MFSKKKIDEDLFCNYLRSNKQKKLINIIIKNKFNVSKLDLNWDYISENDNLTIKFIEYFKDYIDFFKLTKNKNLTDKHIKVFQNNLDWIYLSKYYNFTLNQLEIYYKYIRWEYIFFCNNNPSNDYKIFFKQKMWWLFLDDNLSIDINKKYNIINNKILNKNHNHFPDEIIDKFNFKLQEYQNNKNILKLILKKQLINLYNTHENDNEILNLHNINCINLYKELKNELNCNEEGTQIDIEKKDMSTQTENTISIIEDIKDYERIDSDKTPSSSINEEEKNNCVSIELKEE